jgi:PadR family transcriptional regulator, regulatory protein AphA
MADGSVAYVILGALRHGPKSGYEIKKLVDKAIRFFWAASYGQIYPELRRLEEQGLIEATEEQKEGRRRVRYRLTRTGRTKLVQWLRDPAAGYELRDEGLLKLFFADALSRDDAIELVQAFRREREAILEKLREIDAGKAPGAFPQVVLSYGIEFHEWVVGWCLRLERRLEKTGAEEKAE